MEEKRCFVEFIPDKRLGWIIKPQEDCEDVIKKVEGYLGPHGNRYLGDRFTEPSEKNTDSQPPQEPE